MATTVREIRSSVPATAGRRQSLAICLRRFLALLAFLVLLAILFAGVGDLSPGKRTEPRTTVPTSAASAPVNISGPANAAEAPPRRRAVTPSPRRGPSPVRKSSRGSILRSASSEGFAGSRGLRGVRFGFRFSTSISEFRYGRNQFILPDDRLRDRCRSYRSMSPTV